ncbi:MAG: hypothetical protein AABW52_05600 [Nanoarchaeota archaeon]
MIRKRNNNIDESLLVKARDSPIVNNGLLSIPQFVYCLTWNLHVGDFESVVAGAIGPGLVDILLTLNPLEIYGIDINSPNKERLDKALAKWDVIDSDPDCLPHEDLMIKSHLSPESYANILNETLRRDFSHRKECGYWRIDNINRWSIERCIALELKRMGVKNSSLRISDNDYVAIEFDWAFPGEELKRRKIYFIPSRVDDMINNKMFIGIDCYYEKSSMECTEPSDSRRKLLGLKDIVSSNGIVLIGRTQNPDEDAEVEAMNSRVLEKSFKRIDFDNSYTSYMERTFRKPRYGWELYGFRKN